jgi:hypothetical protein
MSHGPGDSRRPYRKTSLHLAVKFALAQYAMYGKPEHLEHVIYRHRVWVDGTSLEDPGRPEIIEHISFFSHCAPISLSSRISMFTDHSPELSNLPSFHHSRTSPRLNQTLSSHFRGRSSFCTQGTLRAYRPACDQNTERVESTGTISCMVVPNICFLLTPTSRNGSNSIRRGSSAILPGLVYPLIHTVPIGAYRIS